MRLPHPLRFSEGGKLCGLHRAGFPSVCFTLDAPRTKSKSHEVESIVSHPLKFAEGGAASVGLIEGWANPPRLRAARFVLDVRELVMAEMKIPECLSSRRRRKASSFRMMERAPFEGHALSKVAKGAAASVVVVPA